MAQRTVTSQSDLMDALTALTGGGKIIFKDGFRMLPDTVTLPEGSWQFVGQSDAATITILGTIVVPADATLSIQTGNWDFSTTGRIEISDEASNVSMKGALKLIANQSGEVPIVGPYTVGEGVETEGFTFTESEPASDGTEPEVTEPDPEPEPEPEPEVTEPDPETPAEEPPTNNDEPGSDSEEPASDSEGEAAESSGHVINAAVHLGPSMKSRSNAYTGAVIILGSATDAAGHSWSKVSYKLPGNGKWTVGYVLESAIK